MKKPRVGSLWMDTRAKAPSGIVDLAGHGATLRRIVEVLGDYAGPVLSGRFVRIVGRWQQQQPDGEWSTLRERSYTVDAASFNTRFAPIRADLKHY